MRNIKSRVFFVISILWALSTISLTAQADEIDVPVVKPQSGVEAPYAFSANNSTVLPICFNDNKPTSGFECQTIVLQNLTYWPMHYIDNRMEFMLVGFTRKNYGVGKPKQVRVCGVRYVWKAEVDASKRRITFFGQGSSTVSIPWSLLSDDGQDQSTCSK